jgi:hypothetical protein
MGWPQAAQCLDHADRYRGQGDRPGASMRRQEKPFALTTWPIYNQATKMLKL